MVSVEEDGGGFDFGADAIGMSFVFDSHGLAGGEDDHVFIDDIFEFEIDGFDDVSQGFEDGELLGGGNYCEVMSANGGIGVLRQWATIGEEQFGADESLADVHGLGEFFGVGLCDGRVGGESVRSR